MKRKKLSHMGGTMSQINGFNLAGWEAFRDEVRKDASVADRRPTVIARWVGGSRSQAALIGLEVKDLRVEADRAH